MESRGIKPISFRVRLTVKTPFSVTSGRFWTLFDYTVKGKELFVINHDKLVEKLSSNELNRYRSILGSFDINKIVELQEFYGKVVDREVSYYVASLNEEAEGYFKDKFSSLKSLIRGRNFKKLMKVLGRGDVREVIKNPLNFEPYLPGSSLKGALRTSLLNYLVKSGKVNVEVLVRELKEILESFGLRWPASYSKEALERLNPREFSKKLGTFFNKLDKNLLCDSDLKIFGKNPFSRDLMRFIKVSDLTSTSPVKVFVGRYKRLKKEGGEIELSFVEYLPPGSQFEGEITLYPGFLSKYLRCEIDISSSTLIKALRGEYSVVFNKEGKEFLGKPPFKLSGEFVERYCQEKDKLAVIKLGFGAGALSKTLSDAPELRVIGNKATGIRPEPTTLPVVEGKPMGWCLLEVIGGSSDQ